MDFNSLLAAAKGGGDPAGAPVGPAEFTPQDAMDILQQIKQLVSQVPDQVDPNVATEANPEVAPILQ